MLERSSGFSGYGRNTIRFGLLFIAFFIVFLLNRTLILNHFYYYGAYLLDSGLLADLFYHNTFSPERAPILGGGEYNGNHFSPLLNLVNIVSYIVPVDFIAYYAIFQGLVYATLTVAIFLVFLKFYQLTDLFSLVLAFVASISFSFNGVVISCIGYPHFEALTSGLAILFFVFYFKRQMIHATLFFVLCLSVREDSGFHLFGILLTLFIFNVLHGKTMREQQDLVMYSLASFFYSVAALAMQKFYYKAGGTFKQVYMDGHDDFSWLTWGHVVSRLEKYAVTLEYIWVPLLILVVWSFFSRKPILLLGFLAQIPWFLLHVFSTGGISELSTYRLFPFIIALAWPFIVVAKDFENGLERGVGKVVLSGAIILFSLSFYLHVHDAAGAVSFAKQLLPKDYSVEKYAILRDKFLRGDFGASILVDHSVASLEPRAFKHWQVLGNQKEGQRVDLFFHWKDNHFQGDQIMAEVLKQDLRYHYLIDDVNIFIFSRVELPIGAVSK
ncbi:MAG: hypothetical protein HQL75_01510 [Magnetococcales bacterium]|nr:hypothetical protein [Magnetococcales bacterium]